MVREITFAQAFSFKYSPRPGTPAANSDQQIPEAVKTERLTRLQAVLEVQQTAFNASAIGLTIPVLFERQGRRPGQLIGRSPFLQLVHADAGPEFIGKIVPVTVRSATQLSLSGAMAAPVIVPDVMAPA